ASFFFSSRRRHTRSKRDWSSDVCSSDLLQRQLHHHVLEQLFQKLLSFWQLELPFFQGLTIGPQQVFRHDHKRYLFASHLQIDRRSEERRVGKECIYWSLEYCDVRKRGVR